MEKILTNYLITDYISCGLSSPDFHIIFQTTLRSNKLKNKLLNKLMIIWNYIFTEYKVNSMFIFKNILFNLKLYLLMCVYAFTLYYWCILIILGANIEVTKYFGVMLERLFYKIIDSHPDVNNIIIVKFNKILVKIQYLIIEYEQNASVSRVLQT